MAGIPVSLEKAVGALFQNGPDAAVLKLLKTALGNVIREPEEMKFRSLNTAKLVSKLAASGLAPLYILRHAGFVAGETHYVLAPDASVEPVKAALAAVVSRELGVEVEAGSLSVDGGKPSKNEGPAKSTSAFAGKTAPTEVTAADAAEELKRHLEAEEDFKRRKEERLRVQREKQAAEEELKRIEAQMAAEKAQIKDLEKEKAMAEGELKKIEEIAPMEDVPSSEPIQCVHCSLISEKGSVDCQGCGLPLSSSISSSSSSTSSSPPPARVHLPTEDKDNSSPVNVSSSHCPHCTLEREGEETDCKGCGLPLPPSSSSSSSSSTHPLPAQALADGDLDEEMLAIIQGMKKEGSSTTGGGVEGTEGKKLSEMTLEEKRIWVENAKIQNKKRKEAAAIAKEKESERNRVTLAKAAMDLQERQEQFAIKAAQDAKKREEKERRLARERIREKIALDRKERFGDQAAEAREKARQEALRNSGAGQASK